MECSRPKLYVPKSEEEAEVGNVTKKAKINRGGMQPRFLKQLLASLDDDRHECIHFDESGKIILITDWETFVSTVMPEKFEKMGQKSNADRAKISSFLKQMNLYGFVGTRTAGRNTHCDSFYHPSFARDNREACLAITRVKATATSDALRTPEFKHLDEKDRPSLPADQYFQSQRDNSGTFSSPSENNRTNQADSDQEDFSVKSAEVLSDLRVRLEESFHANLSSDPVTDFVAISPGTATSDYVHGDIATTARSGPSSPSVNYDYNSDLDLAVSALLDLSRGSSAQSSAWNSRVGSPNSRRVTSSGASAFNDFLPTYGEDDSCDDFDFVETSGILKGTFS